MTSAANAAAPLQAAMAALGKPITAGELSRALELIDKAAKAGHPEAVERRALFECAGLGRPRDWERALDSLVTAAELGSAAAARQLVLLAEQRFEDAAPANGSASFADLRAKIAISELMQTRGGEVLSAEPLIVSLSGIARPGERRWLIEAAKPRLKRALLATDPPRPDPGRTNRSAWFTIDHQDLIVELVRTRVANSIAAPLEFLEIPQVLHYNPGDQFGLHCDFLNPEKKREEIAFAGQRKTTVIVYLNDDFEGGETSFPELGIDYRGGAGDALAFTNLDRSGQPDLRTQHAGVPPTRGEKWVFSQWVRDRAPGGLMA